MYLTMVSLYVHVDTLTGAVYRSLVKLDYLILPLASLGLHCDVLNETSKESSMITCSSVIKCLNMDVVWSGYAQVCVQYSTVVLLWTFVWLCMGKYSIFNIQC